MNENNEYFGPWGIHQSRYTIFAIDTLPPANFARYRERRDNVKRYNVHEMIIHCNVDTILRISALTYESKRLNRELCPSSYGDDILKLFSYTRYPLTVFFCFIS